MVFFCNPKHKRILFVKKKMFFCLRYSLNRNPFPAILCGTCPFQSLVNNVTHQLLLNVGWVFPQRQTEFRPPVRNVIITFRQWRIQRGALRWSPSPFVPSLCMLIYLTRIDLYKCNSIFYWSDGSSPSLG